MEYLVRSLNHKAHKWNFVNRIFAAVFPLSSVSRKGRKAPFEGSLPSVGKADCVSAKASQFLPQLGTKQQPDSCVKKPRLWPHSDLPGPHHQCVHSHCWGEHCLLSVPQTCAFTWQTSVLPVPPLSTRGKAECCGCCLRSRWGKTLGATCP